MKLYPNLPNMRGFQFFVSFPAPRCPPGLNSKYIADATHKFPHGLFDPKWRLSLCTAAQYLEGYFDKAEVKSDGKIGELRRKTVVSIDKHFIGKETTPLDDDNELIDDGEEPVLECNELVLRSNDRNLQPLIDAAIEFRRGKRLTRFWLTSIVRLTLASLPRLERTHRALFRRALCVRRTVFRFPVFLSSGATICSGAVSLWSLGL
jgi:hypothetical protein